MPDPDREIPLAESSCLIYFGYDRTDYPGDRKDDGGSTGRAYGSTMEKHERTEYKFRAAGLASSVSCRSGKAIAVGVDSFISLEEFEADLRRELLVRF